MDQNYYTNLYFSSIFIVQSKSMSEIIMKNDVLVHVKPVSLSGRLRDPAPGSGFRFRLRLPAGSWVRLCNSG